jgi:serine/threonine protein kinase
VLIEAHGCGILHRDIKPENTFLTTAGEIKVLDFGIARVRESSGELLTQAGFTLGTPAFMAPEQARGMWDEVDERTDLWAVGAVMFNALSGRVVQPGSSPVEELIFAATKSAPKLTSIVPSVRTSVGAIVDRALEKRREDRFVDARSMRAAITEVWPSVAGSVSMREVWRRMARDVVAVEANDVRTSTWGAAAKPRRHIDESRETIDAPPGPSAAPLIHHPRKSTACPPRGVVDASDERSPRCRPRAPQKARGLCGAGAASRPAGRSPPRANPQGGRVWIDGACDHLYVVGRAGPPFRRAIGRLRRGRPDLRRGRGRLV